MLVNILIRKVKKKKHKINRSISGICNADYMSEEKQSPQVVSKRKKSEIIITSNYQNQN